LKIDKKDVVLSRYILNLLFCEQGVLKMSKNYLLGFSILFLAACGGSGAGPTGSSGPGATNSAPVISSGNTYSVAENTTAIGSVSATDADGDSLTFILQGDDSSLVSLTGTTLAFKAAPDFEAPSDANSDNVYEVTIVVSDGSAKDAKDLSITVTNVNEGPQLLAQSAYTVEENNATVTTITVSDASGDVTFSLSGTDSAAMTIGASTGVLAFAANPDFEAPADADTDNVYNVIVTAADSAGSNSADVAVTVTDVVECTGACDLFISEAAEGSSFNKYFEIANFTGADVALVDYAFANVSNAVSVVGEHEFWNPIWDASNTVADGDVHVVCHPSADDKILARCDTEFSFFGNGDDGFKLVKGEESNYTVVDLVGDFQGDPGTAWDVCGVENATKDHTLVKKEGKEGNDDWTDSRGTNAEDCDWIVAENDAFISETNSWDGLGSHCYDSSNDAVTFTSDATFSVAENTTAVGTVAAGVTGCISGEAVTMTLSGADAALFTIDAAGALAFAAAPDFEATGSASGTNDYTVVVTATAGSKTAEQTITVTVTDVDETPPAGILAQFDGVFGGAAFDADTSTYTVPAGSQTWSGIANNNQALYPITLSGGGTITFTAAAPAGDVTVQFRFERLPGGGDAGEPSYNTEVVTVSGTAEAKYVIDVPAQPADRTYSSMILYIGESQSPAYDTPVVVKDVYVDGKEAPSEPEGIKAEMTGVFGSASFDAETSTYTIGGGGPSWSGIANDNTALYPIGLAEGGKITFTAAAPAGDVTVQFRYERLPNPNEAPFFNTEKVTISGAEEKTYTIDVETRPSTETYSSFIMYVGEQGVPAYDTPVVVKDIYVTGTISGQGNGGGTAQFTEAFGSATISGENGDIFTWPTGAEVWAGFANMNTDIYPMKFPNGGSISFTGAATGADVGVQFKFERLPNPNNTPEFFVDTVTLSGATEKTYTVDFPAQNADYTFSSFIMYVKDRDVPATVRDVVVTPAD
jgi:hypothetical protein